MFGLIVSDPAHDEARRAGLAALLRDYDLPLTAFTDAPAPLFSPAMSRAAFLRTASAALLQPGQPLPMEALRSFLSGDPLPANVLRRHLLLQTSLLPYLRQQQEIRPLTGCFLLGEDLLVVPVSPEDAADALLPDGAWTELTGEVHRGHLRCLRGYNETPVLARENALLPIGMNGASLAQSAGNDADRLTLHWFQPEKEARCQLADGTRYHAQRCGDQLILHTTSEYPCHLIVHQDGQERLIR